MHRNTEHRYREASSDLLAIKYCIKCGDKAVNTTEDETMIDYESLTRQQLWDLIDQKVDELAEIVGGQYERKDHRRSKADCIRLLEYIQSKIDSYEYKSICAETSRADADKSPKLPSPKLQLISVLIEASWVKAIVNWVVWQCNYNFPRCELFCAHLLKRYKDDLWELANNTAHSLFGYERAIGESLTLLTHKHSKSVAEMALGIKSAT